MNPSCIAQAYVQHDGVWFFISTINRTCSALNAPNMVYAETMAWRWNPDTRKAGEMVGQGEDGKDCISEHLRILRCLHEHGLTELPEES